MSKNSFTHLLTEPPKELTDILYIPWAGRDVTGNELQWQEIPPNEPDFLDLVRIDTSTIQRDPNISVTDRDKQQFGVGLLLKFGSLNHAPVPVIVDPGTEIELKIKIFAYHSYSQTIIKTIKMRTYVDSECEGVFGWQPEIIESDEHYDIKREIKTMEIKQ